MKRIALGFMSAATLGAISAFAHHSFAMFDEHTVSVLHGKLVTFTFLNPHSWISVVGSIDRQGPAERWDIEATSPMTLRRQGISAEAVKPGDELIVAFHPLRDGRHGGSLVFLVTPDGITHGADPRAAGVDPGTLKSH